MSALCLRCSGREESVEFATIRELVEHERGGHRTRPPKKELPPAKPVTPSATELAAMKEKLEQQPKLEVPIGIQAQTVVNSSAIKPLELQYKWVGIHKDCNMEVKTIEVDLEDKVAIIAYCVNCDQKLQQEKVIPISQQIKPAHISVPKGEKIVDLEKKLTGKKK